MKLLLDQGTPRSACDLLLLAGIDAVHTGNLGMANAKDEDILTFARAENRLIITLDADFHSLLAHSHALKPSVIRIRIEGLRAAEFYNLVLSILRQCESDLEAGAMISVQEDRIRIRLLPIS